MACFDTQRAVVEIEQICLMDLRIASLNDTDSFLPTSDLPTRFRRLDFADLGLPTNSF